MKQSDIDVFDGLLYYLSHVDELRWQKFKDAIKRLTRDNPEHDYKDSTYLTSLARLGHVDYDPKTLDKVVIAPPVLVETAAENRYVLVGSRSADFLKEIKTWGIQDRRRIAFDSRSVCSNDRRVERID